MPLIPVARTHQFVIASVGCQPHYFRVRNCHLTKYLLLAGLVTGPAGLSAASVNELTAREKSDGWKLLFDGKTTAGWHKFKTAPFPGKGWAVEDGWLHGLAKGGGDIISDDQFDQFELSWEWKIAAGGNSGLKYFVADTRSSALGHEYQMIDDAKNEDAKAPQGKHVTASFYDVLAPTSKLPLKAAGEINESRILVKGSHVEHWLNGVKVLEYDCGSDGTKAAVAGSKFKTTPDFGTCVKGHILLQDHSSQVWFRNIKIRSL